MPRYSLVALVFTTACGAASPEPAEEPEGQSFETAMVLICDVDARAGVTPDTDPIDRESARTDYLRSAVTNGDAIELLTYLRVEGPAKRAALLRRATKQAGVSSCALAASFDREAAEEEE